MCTTNNVCAKYANLAKAKIHTPLSQLPGQSLYCTGAHCELGLHSFVSQRKTNTPRINSTPTVISTNVLFVIVLLAKEKCKRKVKLRMYLARYPVLKIGRNEMQFTHSKPVHSNITSASQRRHKQGRTYHGCNNDAHLDVASCHQSLTLSFLQQSVVYGYLNVSIGCVDSSALF